MTIRKFTPLNEEPIETKVEIEPRNDDNLVQKAQDEQRIAEAKLKTRLAEEGLQSLDQIKSERLKLQQANAEFEKHKSKWIDEFENLKQEEIEKIKKVKAYWESKATPVKEIENQLEVINNQLDSREKAVKMREQSLETRISNLDDTIKLKEKQVGELQDIITEKAQHYHKLFKYMLSQGERRANWNENMARSDQWHNFTERICIIFDSLHRMLFGE